MGFETWNTVGVRFETRDDQAVHGADRVAGAYDRVNAAAGNATRTLLGFVGAAVSIGAMTAGLSAMATQYGQLENSQRSLGAMVTAGMDPATPNRFAAAMAQARWLTNGLAEDAARLPGEYADFVNVAQSALGPMQAIHRDVASVRRDVGDLAIVSAIFETRQTGMDFQRMLQGQAGLEQVLWRNLTGMQLIRMNAMEFNKLSPEQRYLTIMEAVHKITGDQALIASVAGSWSTQSSTLKDNVVGVQGVLGQIGRRTMPTVVDQVRMLNAWFDANGMRTSGLADIVANELNPAIARAGEWTLALLNNTERVRDTALAAAAAFALMGGISMAGGTTGVMALGRRAPGMTTAAAPAVAATRADFWGMTAAMAVGSRAAAPAATAATAGLAGAGLMGLMGQAWGWLVAMGPGLAVLVPILASVAGLFLILKTDLWGMGTMLRTSFGMFGTELAELGRTLLGALTPVAVLGGMLVTGALIPLLWVATGLAKILTTIVNFLGQIQTYLTALPTYLMYGNGTASFGLAWDQAKSFRMENLAKDWGSDWMREVRAQLGPGTWNAGKGKDGKGGGFPYPSSQININGPITLQMKLESNEQPDRIAFKTIDALGRLAARSTMVGG